MPTPKKPPAEPAAHRFGPADHDPGGTLSSQADHNRPATGPLFSALPTAVKPASGISREPTRAQPSLGTSGGLRPAPASAENGSKDLAPGADVTSAENKSCAGPDQGTATLGEARSSNTVGSQAPAGCGEDARHGTQATAASARSDGGDRSNFPHPTRPKNLYTSPAIMNRDIVQPPRIDAPVVAERSVPVNRQRHASPPSGYIARGPRSHQVHDRYENKGRTNSTTYRDFYDGRFPARSLDPYTDYYRPDHDRRNYRDRYMDHRRGYPDFYPFFGRDTQQVLDFPLARRGNEERRASPRHEQVNQPRNEPNIKQEEQDFEYEIVPEPFVPPTRLTAPPPVSARAQRASARQAVKYDTAKKYCNRCGDDHETRKCKAIKCPRCHCYHISSINCLDNAEHRAQRDADLTAKLSNKLIHKAGKIRTDGGHCRKCALIHERHGVKRCRAPKCQQCHSFHFVGITCSEAKRLREQSDAASKVRTREKRARKQAMRAENHKTSDSEDSAFGTNELPSTTLQSPETEKITADEVTFGKAAGGSVQKETECQVPPCSHCHNAHDPGLNCFEAGRINSLHGIYRYLNLIEDGPPAQFQLPFRGSPTPRPNKNQPNSIVRSLELPVELLPSAEGHDKHARDVEDEDYTDRRSDYTSENESDNQQEAKDHASKAAASRRKSKGDHEYEHEDDEDQGEAKKRRRQHQKTPASNDQEQSIKRKRPHEKAEHQEPLKSKTRKSVAFKTKATSKRARKGHYEPQEFDDKDGNSVAPSKAKKRKRRSTEAQVKRDESDKDEDEAPPKRPKKRSRHVEPAPATAPRSKSAGKKPKTKVQVKEESEPDSDSESESEPEPEAKPKGKRKSKAHGAITTPSAPSHKKKSKKSEKNQQGPPTKKRRSIK